MINYRNIFNSSYNYIGQMIIIILSLLIIIIEKDTVSSIYRISKYTFISGIVILSLALLSNFIMEFLIFNSYKVFIEIISKNLIENLYFYSIIIIIISGIINLMLKTLNNTKS